MGLEIQKFGAAQLTERHAEGGDLFGFAHPRIAAGLGAKHFYPAARAEQRPGAGGLGDGEVLVDGARDEGAQSKPRARARLGRRRQKIAKHEGGDRRQRGIADMRSRIAIEPRA